MHALTGWHITQRNEVVGMSGSGSTFGLVATYLDEAVAQGNYQVVRDAHAASLAGSCDAAAVTTDASSMARENKHETATRHGAGWRAAAGAVIGVIFPPAVLGATAAGGIAGAVSGHLARRMSRSGARQPGDFTGPGQAGLVTAGESTLEDAIRHTVTRTEKQMTQGPGVDPEDGGRAWPEPVREM